MNNKAASQLGKVQPKTGRIIAYCSDVGAGVIRAACGTQYLFRKSDWRNPTPPSSNMNVAFQPYQRAARDVSVA